MRRDCRTQYSMDTQNKVSLHIITSVKFFVIQEILQILLVHNLQSFTVIQVITSHSMSPRGQVNPSTTLLWLNIHRHIYFQFVMITTSLRHFSQQTTTETINRNLSNTGCVLCGLASKHQSAFLRIVGLIVDFSLTLK